MANNETTADNIQMGRLMPLTNFFFELGKKCLSKKDIRILITYAIAPPITRGDAAPSALSKKSCTNPT